MFARAGLRVPARLSLPFQSSTRPFTSTRVHANANPPPSNQPSSFKAGLARYKPLVSPFAKVFLGAVLTYQVVYWCWLKLEMDEDKFERNKEVAALEARARELTGTTGTESGEKKEK